MRLDPAARSESSCDARRDDWNALNIPELRSAGFRVPVPATSCDPEYMAEDLAFATRSLSNAIITAKLAMRVSDSMQVSGTDREKSQITTDVQES